MDEFGPGPQILTPCGSARRRSIGFSNSPEFEFRNYFPPSPDLVCAAELFSGGVLLPLHRQCPSDESPLMPTPPAPAPDPEPFWSDLGPPEPEINYTPQLPATSVNHALSSSLRWKDIFRKNDKKSSRRRSIDIDAEKEIINSFREMKRGERRNSTSGSGGGGVIAAELNINIWPFSRSTSTGNGAARTRSAAPAPARKVSSAPVSRNNSTGESRSKSNPGRGGVHMEKTSQPRRRSNEAVVRKLPLSGPGDGKAKVLSLNMPGCIGYRQTLSFKNDGNSAGGANAVAGGATAGSGGGSSLFNIKSLFTKKVY